MAPSELDKAVEYTKQFIEAMTPIAKQAYEIGLLTLQIDAAQMLVMSAIILAACVYALRRVKVDWSAAAVVAALPENKGNYHTKDASDHLPVEGALHAVAALFSASISIVCIFVLINLWNWVKLFAPQLWLAHQAIEKIVK